jgi:hypothetical protein
MDVSPNHEPTLIERGTDVHLNYPLTAQRGIHDSRPVRWESWTPHPSALRRGGAGTQKLVEELAPIALSGPRLGGSSHDYTFWTYPNVSKRQYARMALPRPAEITPRPTETNASHTGSTVRKNLAGLRAPLQVFGGYTRGCASTPPQNVTMPRGEESPIRKRQPL